MLVVSRDAKPRLMGGLQMSIKQIRALKSLVSVLAALLIADRRWHKAAGAS